MLKFRFNSLAVTVALAASLVVTVPVIAAEASATAKQVTALTLDDGAGAYKSGQYPNLFVERLHKTPA